MSLTDNLSLPDNHWLRAGENLYLRKSDVVAFELQPSAGEVLIYLRSGLTLRGAVEAYEQLREAYGIAAAERAEYGVYG